MNEFKNKRIVVIGDIGLDQYIIGDVKRISPEAPIPVVEAKSSDERLGLAANVANNIIALGGHAHLVSVVGADDFNSFLTKKLEEAGIAYSLVTDTSRQTTRKVRLMSSHHHIARIDFENTHDIEQKIVNEVFERFKNAVVGADVVVIEDYAKGLFTESMIRGIILHCNAMNIPVIVDPSKKTPSHLYRDATMITPNLEEGRILTGTPDADVRITGLNLLHTLNVKYAVITQGADGISLFSRDQIIQLPALAHRVYDVTGAGDTVVATLALAMAAKMPISDCVALANMAASVVVEKVGTSTCSAEELQRLRDSLVTA